MAVQLAHSFGEGFLWGAATAAHQVEGNNTNNDWWAWEQLPGKIRNGDRSGLACDHYRRFRDDFKMLRSMGHNAHRMSLEWSRIEPTPGRYDDAAIEHYREVLGCLRDLGMEPMVTLHHFTNPRWLAARGGWESPEVVESFRRYAARCVDRLGDLVSLWVTINEPNVYAYQGYSAGLWLPEKKSLPAAATVLRHMVRAHAAAYAEIKLSRHGAGAKVGVAQHLRVFQPWHWWSPMDRLAAGFPHRAFNHWFLRACSDGRAGFPLGLRGRIPEAAGTMDYVGVNYYSRDMIMFHPGAVGSMFSKNFPAPGKQLSDFDMEVYPEGFHTVITDVWRTYRRPVYVTENGVADATDALRPGVLVGHLAELARAQREGVDVRGYLHWSSMDNFEWSEGYAMRFGLVEVDFSTQERRPRPSAALYSEVIARKGLTCEQVERYHPVAARYL
ncbi:MAG: glycoside hydrolase family 1 protein, partial [Candidatus Dormibacteraeota bacterium]|nr:glycoside hydrolase family 1 protein [Candidatus Dormibacteraeota bacterium]